MPILGFPGVRHECPFTAQKIFSNLLHKRLGIPATQSLTLFFFAILRLRFCIAPALKISQNLLELTVISSAGKSIRKSLPSKQLRQVIK